MVALLLNVSTDLLPPQLENLHGERVNNIFDKDLKGRDREIEQLTSSITGKFRHAEQLLKRIGRASEPGQTLSPAEVKVRAAIQSSNASKIQQISAAFRKLQQKYLTDVSAQKSGNDSQFGVDLMSGGGGEGGVGFTDQQMAVVDDLEGIVNERDEEIQVRGGGAVVAESGCLVLYRRPNACLPSPSLLRTPIEHCSIHRGALDHLQGARRASD